jgi:hypothetical protein
MSEHEWRDNWGRWHLSANLAYSLEDSRLPNLEQLRDAFARELLRQVGERIAARESSAATLEAAGCVCWELPKSGPQVFAWNPEDEGPHVAVHDPRCPIALARQIREGA